MTDFGDSDRIETGSEPASCRSQSCSPLFGTTPNRISLATGAAISCGIACLLLARLAVTGVGKSFAQWLIVGLATRPVILIMALVSLGLIVRVVLQAWINPSPGTPEATLRDAELDGPGRSPFPGPGSRLY